MELRKHQKRIVDSNPKRVLLCHEMRTGKSLIAAEWLKKRSNDVLVDTLIVCPKQLKKHWIELCPRSMVYSKEEFKKNAFIFNMTTNVPIKALIIDEAHTFASPLFTKGRSQLATAMYKFIARNPEMDIMLLSATPITNNPASLHTLLCVLDDALSNYAF